MVSSYLAMPSDGHLQVFHIFSNLGSKHNARMVFDPRYPNLDYSKFEKRDWSSFYGEVKEEIPDNIPTAHRSEFIILCFCDSEHAGDQLTRRSRTGFTVYLNSAPIYWFFKKQNSLETSSFGSEFCTMIISLFYRIFRS